MTEPATNKTRAETALHCLVSQYSTENGNPYHTDVCDILTDLRHLCDMKGIDFQAELERSGRHWLEEVQNEV